VEDAIVSHSKDDVPVSVACVSTPTIFKWFKQHTHSNIDVKVFEFDRRFLRYGDDFVYYDYESPTMLRKKFHGCFDWVVVDPPFLSEEVLEKYAQTIELIMKKEGRIILMTGIKVRTFILENLGEKFGLKECVWKPSHSGSLKNDFGAFTNFEAVEMGGWLKREENETG
jgi:EEF1A lysine methyltransferase 1